jgi:hypothetical protein
MEVGLLSRHITSQSRFDAGFLIGCRSSLRMRRNKWRKPRKRLNLLRDHDKAGSQAVFGFIFYKTLFTI